MDREDLKKLLMKYKGYTAVLVVLLVLVVALTCGCGNKNAESSDDTLEAGVEQAEDEEESEPENNLEENNHASVERLAVQYCEALANGDVESLRAIINPPLSEEEENRIKARAEVIEANQNIVCYTKNGPEEDSFIVFLCYDVKFKNIDTLAPNIITLYFSGKDNAGNRYIDGNGSDNEELQAYVIELEQDPDVQKLFDDINSRYQEALESDTRLNEFIALMNGQVVEKEETPADEEPTEETEEGEEPTEGSEEEAQSEESSEATAQNRQTRVNDTVNVRSEASTDSARVAVAYKGETITEIESYDNGWSKVEFKGVNGYVKTEFLE